MIFLLHLTESVMYTIHFLNCRISVILKKMEQLWIRHKLHINKESSLSVHHLAILLSMDDADWDKALNLPEQTWHTDVRFNHVLGEACNSPRYEMFFHKILPREDEIPEWYIKQVASCDNVNFAFQSGKEQASKQEHCLYILFYVHHVKNSTDLRTVVECLLH